MANFSISEFKNGLKILLEGNPMIILENEFVKPGKGQAFNRVKLRNLENGRVLEKTFKSAESVEAADVLEINASYFYFDGESYIFIDDATFERYTVSNIALNEAKKWIKPQDNCVLTLLNGGAIAVMAPNFVQLSITETDPGLKGDTVGTGGKPATLETGAVVRMPLFVQTGEIIKVDSRNGEYVSQVKE